MRKYGWTQAALAALLGFAAPAGPVEAQRPLIVAGGLTMSTIGGDDVNDEEVESRTGFFVAVGTSFALSPTLSISPFVGYTERGWESPDGEAEVKVTYIDVPVMLGLAVPLGETFGLNISAGPRVSFNLGCDFEGEGVSVECDAFEEIGVEPESIDFGVLGDVGLAFQISPTVGLGVGAGYDLGLIDVFEDISATHRGPYFYVGLSFLMGG